MDNAIPKCIAMSLQWKQIMTYMLTSCTSKRFILYIHQHIVLLKYTLYYKKQYNINKNKLICALLEYDFILAK